MAGRFGINALTPSAADPTSKQPELKHAAVQVDKLTDGHALMAMRRVTGDDPFAVLAALRRQLPDLPSASLTLAGREVPVVVLKARVGEAETALLDAVDAAMGLDDPAQTLAYADTHRDIAKRARVDDDILSAVRLSGETRA